MRRAVLLVALAACATRREPPPDPAPPPAAAHVPTPYVVALPPDIAPMPVPADNPLTVEGVELGRWLFYDPLLSGDGTRSCGSCHQQARGFTDGRARSLGVRDQVVRRNAMALVNLAWTAPYFWDGRAATLEELVPIPIQAPDELDQDLDRLVEELRAHPAYPERFARAFPGEGISRATISKAIAQFLRTLVSFDSPIDRFHRGEYRLSEREMRGQKLLTDPLPRGAPAEQRDLCDRCHRHDAGLVAPNGFGLFTDVAFRSNGLPRGAVADEGRGEVSGKAEDALLFKVPTIRNITVTGPYMHDGRFATLEQVLRHYDAGIQPGADEKLLFHGAPVRLGLTDEDIADILVSLELFTDRTFLTNPAFASPFDPPLTQAGAAPLDKP